VRHIEAQKPSEKKMTNFADLRGAEELRAGKLAGVSGALSFALDAIRK